MDFKMIRYTVSETLDSGELNVRDGEKCPVQIP